MNIAALIPARIGSKRVPQKNIKPLGGKPLLFWSIDVALASDLFNSICVSTESYEVANLVREHYPKSEVSILLRPELLATDDADLRDVCLHFLDQEKEAQFLFLLMPTYPFRDSERIIHEIAPALFSRQVDRVASVGEGSYSTFDYWIKNGDRFHRMFKGRPLWCGAGNAAYFLQRRDYFYLEPNKWPALLGERTLRIQTSYKESIDIDTENDFEQAKKVCSGKRIIKKKLNLTGLHSMEIVTPEGADVQSFCQYVDSLQIRKDRPVLILQEAKPLFTFLRWYECCASDSCYTEETEKLIEKIPASGHSQNFPRHFIHSPYYRILRKNEDQEGIKDSSVPVSQVISVENMKAEWNGYTDPVKWTDMSVNESVQLDDKE